MGAGHPISVGVAASYSRFSSSLQREEGIADQQRLCRERAKQDGYQMDPALEFSDHKTSGTKRERDGLNAMLEAAKQGRFQVLYLFSLSRLARESVITMPILKQLVHTHRVRIVCLTEGIDTARPGWELTATVIAVQHEQYIKDLRENVLRGQDGTVVGGYSVGDYCFGYSSEAIAETESSRRSRHAKPRKRYIVDQETAPWVVRMFDWYVVERHSIAWIVRELNRLGAPKDHRSSTPDWHQDYIRRYLANSKYIGIWPWGESTNVRDPLSGDLHQEPRSDEECRKWLRHFPDLQIIPHEKFAQAQERLAKNKAACEAHRKETGRLAGSQAGFEHRAARHLLSGLIECAECGSRFNVGGAHGKYLFCPRYKRGTCSCQTQLLRSRAERMILEEVGSRVLANPAWTKAVVEAARQAVEKQIATTPDELATCERQLADIERRIGFLLDKVETGQSDPDVDQRLAERRTERRDLQQRLEALRRANTAVRELPTEEWVRERLANLGEVLESSTPAAAEALRSLLGGRVVVSEIRHEGHSRHFLQGRFTIEVGGLTSALLDRMTGEPIAPSDILRDEVVIDFVEPDDQIEAVNRVKDLADQNLPFKEIAVRLSCSRANVTRLWKLWHTTRGLEVPDGRAQRASRANFKASTPTTPPAPLDDRAQENKSQVG